MPTDAELTDYYASGDFDVFVDPKGDAGAWGLGPGRAAPRNFRMVSSTGLSSGSWLDIGAGRGFLLDAAKAAGWATAAVEADPGGVKQLSCNGHVVYPVLSSVSSSWDVISLSHFVEHVIDPVGLMQAVTGLLNPGGVVCFEVPNCGRFEQPSTHDDPHTLFFSERGGRTLLCESGAADSHCRMRWTTDRIANRLKLDAFQGLRGWTALPWEMGRPPFASCILGHG